MQGCGGLVGGGVVGHLFVEAGGGDVVGHGS